MNPVTRGLAPSERRSAIVLLAAVALAATAALEPFGGTDGPPAEPGLHPPALARDWQSGAYAAGSPFDPARRALGGVGRLAGSGDVVAAPPPVLTLAGILVEGNRRKAMFTGVGGGNWQEAGSTVGDWLVEAVEPRAVRLSRGGETMVLRSDEALR